MSIFVIDDHPLMREAVVMLLRRLRASTQVVELERLASVNKAIIEHGVQSFVHWLGQRSGELVFHTDNVRRDIEVLPELAEHSAGVLAVAISQIHSHYLLWFRPEQVRTVNWAGQPTKQFVTSEQVAAVALFLASEDSSYMTGQTIYPDGGRLGLNYTVPVRRD